MITEASRIWNNRKPWEKLSSPEELWDGKENRKWQLHQLSNFEASNVSKLSAFSLFVWPSVHIWPIFKATLVVNELWVEKSTFSAHSLILGRQKDTKCDHLRQNCKLQLWCRSRREKCHFLASSLPSLCALGIVLSLDDLLLAIFLQIYLLKMRHSELVSKSHLIFKM